MDELQNIINGLKIVDDEFIKKLTDIQTRISCLENSITELVSHFQKKPANSAKVSFDEEDAKSVVSEVDSESSFIIHPSNNKIVPQDPALRGDQGGYHISKKKLKEKTLENIMEDAVFYSNSDDEIVVKNRGILRKLRRARNNSR